MLFDQEFINSAEENPVFGVVSACNRAFDVLEDIQDGSGWNEDEHGVLWEAASFIDIFLEAHGLSVDVVFPQATSNMQKNCAALRDYIDEVRSTFELQSTQLQVDSYRNRYRATLKAAFAYEFSQGDYDRIQILVTELRSQIIENQKLDDDHKNRLLKRLEKLQSELHKRVSDLDRFWGMIGDAGVVMGKLGTDAKPIVDRLKELAEIVWKTQARTEELPSNATNPVLEHDKSQVD